MSATAVGTSQCSERGNFRLRSKIQQDKGKNYESETQVVLFQIMNLTEKNPVETHEGGLEQDDPEN